MGLFGRKKKDLTSSGLPGTAVIRSEERAELFNDTDNTSLTDFGLGSYKFRFELEVTLDDGRPPYTVKGKFKVPAKLGGETGPGVSLPVYADPDNPTRIEVNWEQFLATGGAEAFREGQQAQQRVAVHQATPDALRNTMLNSWISATKGGAMSAAAFESALGDALQAGLVTPEEADAARTSVG